ncbi:MAG: cell division protein ZipA C-terminal FtsZ-binding domain-containing protein [Betaproteobacteria bacterium]|nr:cell division protein ZipA C-terminal FtsZ-binding domain-containing protein [Betaproteobacteria bacterium]MBI2510060.1 cell division protein ZipA C-terminal FtsZ-binding domain-containing protein [Betaproteobacteria bacterium]
MSDLQLSLLAIGALVVAAVCLYNWMQERRFRRRLRRAFGDAPDDVLLRSGIESVLADGRLEPQLDPATAAGGRDRPPAPGFDAMLDYVAGIDSSAPIAEPAVDELMSKIADCGKPVQVRGYDAESGEWEEVLRGAGGGYSGLRIALQLVNRSGPVNAAQLSSFCDAVRSCADRAAASAACPDTRAALATARELDAFCSNVDVAFGFNIIAREGDTFAGVRIRALAESAGFKLESDGVFHFPDEHRRTAFTLDNHEPAPFLPERIKTLSTHGITVLLDVPRVADGPKVLDRMHEIARGLATTLGGRLVDDNRAVLNETSIARIREQLRSIHAAMEARGIPAGGVRALRLFS